MKKLVIAAFALCLPIAATHADEITAGDWLVRVGFHDVNPKQGNALDDAVQVKADTSPTFNISYFFTDHIAVELQAATPFNHDIELAGVGKIGNTKQLPPTLNVQYHFPLGNFKPYLGAGINWTLFFDEGTTQVLTDFLEAGSSDLQLDDSFGIDAQVGVDYSIGNNWFLNAEVRWLDIDSDAQISADGTVAVTDTVSIDPIAYALSVGRKF